MGFKKTTLVVLSIVQTTQYSSNYQLQCQKVTSTFVKVWGNWKPHVLGGGYKLV